MAERKSTARVPAGVEPLGPLASQVTQGFYFPLLFWVCLLAGLALFGFIVALAAGLVGPAVPDESFRQFQFQFPLIAGPLGALFFGGLGYYCWLQTQKRVWVSPVGFAWVTPGRCELFPWGQVKKVKFPLKIEREDGYKVNLSQHVDGMESALPFEEFWVPLQITKVREQLDRGETVKFGAFHVSRDGVTKGGELLPWKYLDRIVRITGQVNAIQLFMKGRTLPWCTVGLNSVTNHLVFQRLVVDMVNDGRTQGD
jgi:hypothetical protein